MGVWTRLSATHGACRARILTVSTPPFSRSPAGHEGREDTASALLRRGARQALQSRRGASALSFAVLNDHERVVRALCAAPGADEAAVALDGSGRTPLVLAVERGREALVEVLLQRPGECGDVDLPNAFGRSPLMIACLDGRARAVRALLAAGAAQELQDGNGDCALHFAVHSGHAAVVEALCAAPGARAALALRDSDGRTPLALAVEDGLERCADVLRAHGAE